MAATPVRRASWPGEIRRDAPPEAHGIPQPGNTARDGPPTVQGNKGRDGKTGPGNRQGQDPAGGPGRDEGKPPRTRPRGSGIPAGDGEGAGVPYQEKRSHHSRGPPRQCPRGEVPRQAQSDALRVLRGKGRRRHGLFPFVRSINRRQSGGTRREVARAQLLFDVHGNRARDVPGTSPAILACGGESSRPTCRFLHAVLQRGLGGVLRGVDARVGLPRAGRATGGLEPGPAQDTPASVALAAASRGARHHRHLVPDRQDVV